MVQKKEELIGELLNLIFAARRKGKKEEKKRKERKKERRELELKERSIMN